VGQSKNNPPPVSTKKEFFCVVVGSLGIAVNKKKGDVMKVYVTTNGKGEVILVKRGMIKKMRALGFKVEKRVFETLRNIKTVITK
jgi:hypothetical protein